MSLEATLSNLKISDETRREMAKQAFWGNDETLADRIKLILGYEMNGKWYPANGFSLADAIKVVNEMLASELFLFIADPVYVILQDDTELLTGDETSIYVIYNNLTGRNLSGEDYSQYLANMKISLEYPSLVPEKLSITVK